MSQEKIDALNAFPIGEMVYYIDGNTVRPAVVIWNNVLKDTILFSLRMADVTNEVIRIVKMQNIGITLFTTEDAANAALQNQN